MSVKDRDHRNRSTSDSNGIHTCGSRETSELIDFRDRKDAKRNQGSKGSHMNLKTSRAVRSSIKSGLSRDWRKPMFRKRRTSPSASCECIGKSPEPICFYDCCSYKISVMRFARDFSSRKCRMSSNCSNYPTSTKNAYPTRTGPRTSGFQERKRIQNGLVLNVVGRRHGIRALSRIQRRPCKL